MITAAALTCLALNVYYEARSEPLEGQLAVAEVTLNRVASSRYPDDICGVVYQRKQFSWTHDGKSDTPDDMEAWKVAKSIATIATKELVPAVTTKDTLHYHADYVTPHWARGKEPVAAHGRHLFYEGIR